MPSTDNYTGLCKIWEVRPRFPSRDASPKRVKFGRRWKSLKSGQGSDWLVLRSAYVGYARARHWVQTETANRPETSAPLKPAASHNVLIRPATSLSTHLIISHCMR